MNWDLAEIEKKLERMNTEGLWQHQAPTRLGTELIKGATELLKAIYTYNSDKPEYLPTSYTPTTNSPKRTNYTYHHNHPTHLCWEKPSAVLWRCEPRDDRGYVESLTEDTIHDPLTATDCSGLATGLFVYPNYVAGVTSAFDGWKPKQLVPLVSGILDDRKAFNPVDPGHIQPGDFIGYPSTGKGAHYHDGHIMLVVAAGVPPDAEEEGISQYLAVIDETGSGHSFDPRNQGKVRGVGIGYVRITNEAGKKVFWWGLSSKSTREGEIHAVRPIQSE